MNYTNWYFKGILNYRKPAFWIIMLAISACVIVAVCLMTDPFSTKTLDSRLKESMDTAIADRHSSNSSRGSYFTTSYDVLRTTRSDSNMTVYAMIYYGDYSYDGKELVNISGAFGPAAITFDTSSENEGSTYKVIEYWEPRDGEYYEEDIKSKFPRSIQRKAFDVSRAVSLKEKNLKTAADYFKELPSVEEIYADTLKVYAGAFTMIEPSLYQMNNDSSELLKGLHLPVFLVDTLEDMDHIRDLYETTVTGLGESYRARLPLDDLRPKPLYDEAFFSDHSLLIAYLETGNSNTEYGIRGVYLCDYGHTLVMGVKSFQAEGDDHIKNYLLVAELLDSDIEQCERYDAVFIGDTTQAQSQDAVTQKPTSIAFKGTFTDGVARGAFYEKCLNYNAQMDRHHMTYDSWQAPIFRLDTLEDLKSFKDYFKDVDLSEHAQKYGRKSLDDVFNEYDRDFFSNHSLLISYINSPTSNAKYSIYKIIVDKQYLRMFISMDEEGDLTAMTQWFAVAEVADSDISDCIYFDAAVIRNKNVAAFMETTVDIEARTRIDYLKEKTESEEEKTVLLWREDDIDVEKIKNDTIIEIFGDFDNYMNDTATNEQIDRYRFLLIERFKEPFLEANRRMIESVEALCGPCEVVHISPFSSLCRVKMNDSQIEMLSQLPFFYHVSNGEAAIFIES